MSEGRRVAAIEGWFSLEERPHLIGSRCRSCGNYFFPKHSNYCRNTVCEGTTF